MTKIFSETDTQTESGKTKVSLPELICFVFLFVGLMIILIPSSQRSYSAASVTTRHSAAYHRMTAHAASQKNNVATPAKTALALNRSRSIVH